jgi:hypothetical protein
MADKRLQGLHRYLIEHELTKKGVQLPQVVATGYEAAGVIQFTDVAQHGLLPTAIGLQWFLLCIVCVCLEADQELGGSVSVFKPSALA